MYEYFEDILCILKLEETNMVCVLSEKSLEFKGIIPQKFVLNHFIEP